MTLPFSSTSTIISETKFGFQNIEDEELRAEIIRQVWQQDGVGLEHEGDLQEKSAVIRLRNEGSK